MEVYHPHGLETLNDTIFQCHLGIFGHIVRLPINVPVPAALCTLAGVGPDEAGSQQPGVNVPVNRLSTLKAFHSVQDRTDIVANNC